MSGRTASIRLSSPSDDEDTSCQDSPKTTKRSSLPVGEFVIPTDKLKSRMTLFWASMKRLRAQGVPHAMALQQVLEAIDGPEEDNVTQKPMGRPRTTFGIQYDPTSKKKYRGVTSTRSGHDAKLHIGRFATAEEAARAYDDAARKVKGDKAVLNFPEDLGGDTIEVRQQADLGAAAEDHAEGCGRA